jgi:hypothetical protein
MANRRSSPPPPQAPQRTAAHMLNDISRIQRCIGELQGFDLTTVRDRSDPRIRSLEVSISQVLTQAFGGDGPERCLYDAAASLDHAPLTLAQAATEATDDEMKTRRSCRAFPEKSWRLKMHG